MQYMDESQKYAKWKNRHMILYSIWFHLHNTVEQNTNKTKTKTSGTENISAVARA